MRLLSYQHKCATKRQRSSEYGTLNQNVPHPQNHMKIMQDLSLYLCCIFRLSTHTRTYVCVWIFHNSRRFLHTLGVITLKTAKDPTKAQCAEQRTRNHTHNAVRENERKAPSAKEANARNGSIEKVSIQHAFKQHFSQPNPSLFPRGTCMAQRSLGLLLHGIALRVSGYGSAVMRLSHHYSWP